MGVMTSPASDSLKEIAVRLDQRIHSVDEARWLSSRYASEGDRVTLISLYAFSYELARIRLAVSDQTLGSIRFQWWRDALSELACGEVRQHDVVLALADQLARDRLSIADLLPLIDQHEAAFLENDRSLEPEAVLVQVAARVLSGETPVDEALKSIAQEWAGLRRSEPVRALLPRLRVDTALRPAVGHFRLRHLWARNPNPSALQKRASVLTAMLTGRV